MKHLRGVSRAQTSPGFCNNPQSQTDSLLCFLFVLLTDFFEPLLSKDDDMPAV